MRVHDVVDCLCANAGVFDALSRELASWLAHDFIHVRQLNRLHRHYLAAELSNYLLD